MAPLGKFTHFPRRDSGGGAPARAKCAAQPRAARSLSHTSCAAAAARRAARRSAARRARGDVGGRLAWGGGDGGDVDTTVFMCEYM